MNEADIPDSGAVFTFGRSRFADNVPSHFFIRNDPIIEISCGDQHTAVVCKYGRVFSFGSNEWGQLGLGHKDPVNKPSCVKSLKPEKVKHVACGRVHTVFTTENSKVYSCGCNTDGQLGIGDNEMLDYVALPMFVTELEEEIVQVSAGSQHSVLLTAKGTVYVWGSNTDGQLGLLQSSINIYTDPTLLNIAHKIIRVDCGYYHTGFISDTGELLLCGNCENGKLGVNDDDIKEQWIPTKALIPEKIVSVACGGHHTIALTEEGKCYVCGDNSYGQLGVEGVNATVEWMHLSAFSDLFIKSVSAGESHSIFLTDDGQLFACGDTRYGKLCTNDIAENSVTKPLKINFPIPSLILNMVVCGGCHTMVMASPPSHSNKLSTIKETKAPKIEKSFLLNENNKMRRNSSEENNHSLKLDPPSLQNIVETVPIINDMNHVDEKHSLSFTTDIDRNSLEDISDKNSPIIDKPNPLNSEEVENVKNTSNGQPNISNEFRNINKIQTESVIQNPMEIKSDPETTTNITDYPSFATNGKPSSEGRFKRLLRQIGLRKVIETKNENNNIPPTYKGTQERNATTKPEGNHATSKVCTLL